MSARINQSGYDRMTSMVKQLGASEPDDLIPLLQSSNSRLAARACSTLGSTGKKAFSTVLLTVLQGRRPSLWMPAAAAISQLESRRMVRPLIHLMLDPSRSDRQRQAAAYALSFTWTALADVRYTTSIGEAFVTILQNRHEPTWYLANH